MNLFKTLKQGQRYLDSWVLHAKLSAIFAENRVIKATKFAQKMMPFVAVFAVTWQQLFAKGDHIALAVAIFTAIFALCVPLQGLYWLGKRAQTPLQGKSAVQFERVFQLLQQHGVTLSKVENPTYQDFARLLQQAQQHLAQDFWREL